MDPVRRSGATEADFWAIPDGQRFHELIDGEILEKATPSGEHGDAAGGIIASVRGPFQRGAGRGGPGGWWIQTEVEVRLPGGGIVRPDVLGWRRERCPERPTGAPVTVLPDWICEVVSPNNAKHDTVKKLRLYHRNAVPHHWLVDSRDETLTVMRYTPEGYLTVLTAERGEVVRPEPFDAIELVVGTLFGVDPPDR
ncbi:MAG TPA: Uma2 family endonuclease [Kofleriaceae bacterium]|nr:Uma2 family endonuclease [Kofleriaceae bacterium]